MKPENVGTRFQRFKGIYNDDYDWEKEYEEYLEALADKEDRDRGN